MNRSTSLTPQDINSAYTKLLIDVTLPTIEEISMAIMHIQNERAAGLDNIPAEALKSDIEETAQMLLTLIGRIWKQEQVPTDLKDG
ncbi:unnamed protein product [Schistosoma mattheei]|uniref:Uncharacterized protein n=1 Tax=Schistosoma mattheei TaxID=31246 RepID=A0A183NLL8_9TREM|nr:unnamed protein product [Schistosoma mattheei]